MEIWKRQSFPRVWMETSIKVFLFFCLGDLHHGLKHGTAHFASHLGASLGGRVTPCAPGNVWQLCSLPVWRGQLTGRNHNFLMNWFITFLGSSYYPLAFSFPQQIFFLQFSNVNFFLLLFFSFLKSLEVLTLMTNLVRSPLPSAVTFRVVPQKQW